jgi:hypothetical protein
LQLSRGSRPAGTGENGGTWASSLTGTRFPTTAGVGYLPLRITVGSKHRSSSTSCSVSQCFGKYSKVLLSSIEAKAFLGRAEPLKAIPLPFGQDGLGFGLVVDAVGIIGDANASDRVNHVPTFANPLQVYAGNSKCRQRLREPLLAGFELLHGRFTLGRLYAVQGSRPRREAARAFSPNQTRLLGKPVHPRVATCRSRSARSRLASRRKILFNQWFGGKNARGVAEGRLSVWIAHKRHCAAARTS